MSRHIIDVRLVENVMVMVSLLGYLIRDKVFTSLYYQLETICSHK